MLGNPLEKNPPDPNRNPYPIWGGGDEVGGGFLVEYVKQI